MKTLGRLFRILPTAALLCAAAARADAAPETVMSLDFCADQFVLALADRNQIMALSDGATGPESFYAERALGLPKSHGSLEDVLAGAPALQVHTWRGTPAGDALAARAGTQTFQPPWTLTLEDNFNNLETAGAALGHADRGRALAADYRARLAALKAQPGTGLKAVYMTPSGFTAGVGTYVDDVIHLAGLGTIAADIDLHGWAPLPLEKMVLSPPDLVIGSYFNEGAVHISSWASGRHDVYKRLLHGRPVIMVPSRYLSCGGAFFVDAAEYIRAEAQKAGLLPDTEAAR
ncbi:MAG: ABC transporter substrate-binding protein [Alphaproteobacteria bacterium]|nr:MAG: ABC transporter substrate-binding protein [Alphaproteobacteria bacterium]